MKTRKPSASAPKAARKTSRSARPPAASEAATMARVPQEVAALAAETSEPPLAVPVVSLVPVRIGYFNPAAREVGVAGSFNQWDARTSPLARDVFGDWSIQLLLPPGEYRYRLVVDGAWCDDPNARRTVPNPYGGFDAVIDV